MIRFTPAKLKTLHHIARRMPIKGIIPGARMFSLQEGLPNLPVPALDQTLQKYLNLVKILVPDDQYQQTMKVVSEFQQKTGPQLQNLLLDFAKNKENWLGDWWTDIAYLGNRLPVTINVNPGTCMPTATFTGEDKQIQHAAHVIGGILDYKRQIDNQSLPVEYMGKRPLCMSQFYLILCGCRVPGPGSDRFLSHPPNEPNPPTNIVVAYRNRFYDVNVYDSNKQPLPVPQIYHLLQDIVNRNGSDAPPVGVLTTMQRDDWSEAYQHLLKDKQNAQNCDAINRSIVVVCLDKPNPLASPDNKMADTLQSVIHGCGSQSNTSNRWFDKTLQFVVSPDNESGVCYEHTSAEGPPITSLMDHVVKYVKKKQPIADSNPASITPPRELKFNVDSTIQQWISQAAITIDQSISQLLLRAFTYDKYGKNLIKSSKLSPDAYIQQAIQLAYHRIHNKPGNTYESGSTRMFKYGRTDTIRTCSDPCRAFVTAIDQPNVSSADKVDLLRDAVQSHRSFTDQVISGQGIDRHMLGLKLTALQNSLPLPDLFTDPSFSDFMTFDLSTSQVTSKSEEAAMAYGPAITDGYAVCYNPADNKMYFTVTTFKQSTVTQIDHYTELLHLSLDDMMKLIASNQRAKL